MKLDLYNKRRNFSKTPEPKSKSASSSTKNLFVIQKHAARNLHYDFRLELNGVLLSWAVPKGPCFDPKVKRLAIQTEDHPIEYGTFEGIIPKGEYGGGTVMLWDKGKWISDDDPTQSYHKGHLRFTLKGKKLKGHWSLIKLKASDDKSWLLIKSTDKFAKPLNKFDLTLEEPNNVLSKLTIKSISKKSKKINSHTATKLIDKISFSTIINKSKIPAVISPQLATLIKKAPAGDNWLHEVKFDGYRILAFLSGKSIKLLSRNNKDWTRHFPNVVNELLQLPIKKAIFDGEIVLLDKKQRSNFQLLQNSLNDGSPHSFIYYIFDILFYDQYNLMKLPLWERKEILHKIITSNDGPVLRYSDHIVGSGDKLLIKCCALGLEGIISKEVNSQYIEKRSQNWLKVKCLRRQEFIIGGYSKPKMGRKYFGSLLLGYYDSNNELIYCGKVGTGFSTSSLKTIYKMLQGNKSLSNPFNSNPSGYKSTHWVKPKLIAEVEFTEWTNEGYLRHPSFKGLRTDKKTIEIKKEEPVEINKLDRKARTKSKTSQSFRLTHPDKILFAKDKITKLDLANYYDNIHAWILPYIVNRPLSVLRCPEDFKNCFYQKHINTTTPKELYGVAIDDEASDNNGIYIKDKNGLMALVQMGVLEIHPWGSKIKNIEHPDIITFDIDPAPGIPWKKVVAAAILIRDQLKSYQLESFVKTTGGKGLHVVVPIKPEYDWDQVKLFSHVFVQFLVSRYSNDYVDEMSKQKRKGKIFIDYLRNQRSATAIAPYSSRARPHIPISTPLAWDELTNNIKDTTFTILTLPGRVNTLKKDPWHNFFQIKQRLRLNKL